MSTSSVAVKKQVVIVPSEPTPNHILQLSALDSQLFVRFTFDYLLVYKPPVGVDRALITDNVKSALGRALVPYYPLAGRVRSRADGSGLEVVCRAQGALFIDAVSNSTVSEFNGAPRQESQWRKFLSLHVADVLDGAPPLVVQLTWLSDGGATLAVGFNHCLCDGVGSGEFLNSFAELALGLKPKPAIWSRHLLALGLTHDNSLSRHPEFESVPDISGFTSRYVQERLVPTAIIFNKTMLNELKKLSKSTPTSFEVLSAYVWRSWARALSLPSNQIVKLVFTVNIRQRVNPSIPSEYYGNAFVLGCAETSVGDLIGNGLRYATELVMRAKERVRNGYVREVVELVSLKRDTIDSVGSLIMTQWSRLGLESVDFGIGKPVHVSPVCSDKHCMLCPVPSLTAGIKVHLAVLSSAVDQYLYFVRNFYA